MKIGGAPRFSGTPQTLRRLSVAAGLLLVAGILAGQGVWSSIAQDRQEEDAAQIEALSQTLGSRMQKHARDFRAATTEATGDVVSDLALARQRVPDVSDIKWWDRASLDDSYTSLAIAANQGFARLADAERLLAGNEKVVATASFTRVPKIQDPVLVLSAKHADRVIQALRPSADILETFQQQAPSGLTVALVQDGQVVSVTGGASLDLSALDVVSVGPVRLSVAYQPRAIPSPWLGALPLQWMAAGVMALLALVIAFLPRLRRPALVAGKKKGASEDTAQSTAAAPAPVFRPAAVVALPSSMQAAGEEVGPAPVDQATAPSAQSPNYSVWFTASGLVFEEGDSRPLPDSSQMRSLMRGFVEQLGDVAGKRVILATDGRPLSQSLGKWSSEALSSSGAHVQIQSPLPLSAIPFVFAQAKASAMPAEVVLWIGDGREEVEASGLVVYQDSGFWTAEEYGRWRLRMGDHLPAHLGNEGDVVEVEPEQLIPALVDRLAVTMQVERPIRAVIDFGNGPIAPLALEAWEAVGMEVVPLHGDVDPSFPNSLARAPSGWSSLSSTVRQFRAEFGAGVSIDGRSFILVNEDGQHIPNSSVVALLAADVLSRHPGARVEFNPQLLDADVIAHAIRESGGIPVPREDLLMNDPLPEGVQLSVADSGNGMCVRFPEDMGAPDAIYAIARVAVLLSLEDQPLAARLDAVVPAV